MSSVGFMKGLSINGSSKNKMFLYNDIVLHVQNIMEIVGYSISCKVKGCFEDCVGRFIVFYAGFIVSCWVLWSKLYTQIFYEFVLDAVGSDVK